MSNLQSRYNSYLRNKRRPAISSDSSSISISSQRPQTMRNVPNYMRPTISSSTRKNYGPSGPGTLKETKMFDSAGFNKTNYVLDSGNRPQYVTSNGAYGAGEWGGRRTRRRGKKTKRSKRKTIRRRRR